MTVYRKVSIAYAIIASGVIIFALGRYGYIHGWTMNHVQRYYGLAGAFLNNTSLMLMLMAALVARVETDKFKVAVAWALCLFSFLNVVLCEIGAGDVEYVAGVGLSWGLPGPAIGVLYLLALMAVPASVVAVILLGRTGEPYES